MIIILIGMSLIPINNIVQAQNEAYEISEGNSLNLDVDKFGGIFYILLDISVVGSYNISIQFPNTVRTLSYEIINDVDIYLTDSYYSMGNTIVQRSIINYLDQDDPTFIYSIFKVLQVPDKNSLGLVISYSTNDYELLDDTTGQIVVYLENNGLVWQNSITMKTNEWMDTHADIMLSHVESPGIYKLTAIANGELPYTDILLNIYPSQIARHFQLSRWYPNETIYLYLTSDMEINAQLFMGRSLYVYTTQFDFVLTKVETDLASSKSYEFSDYLVLELPTLYSPKNIQISNVGDSEINIEMLSAIQSKTLDYLDSGEKLDSLIFETGTRKNMFAYNLIPDTTIRTENSIYPNYDQSEYSFKNIGIVTKSFHLDYMSYDLIQNMHYLSQISGSSVYILIKNNGDTNAQFTLNMEDYTPVKLNNYGLKTLLITRDSLPELYEIDIAENSQKLIASGNFETSVIIFNGQSNAYSSGGLAIFNSDSYISLNLNSAQKLYNEYPVITPGKYIFAFTGYLHQIGANFSEIDTSTVSISLDLNITHTIGEAIFERSTETFVLGNGQSLPSSQMRVFNIEKDNAYQVFVDMGPFKSITYGYIFYPFYDYYYYNTYLMINFVNPDGFNPFRENNDLILSGSISSTNQVFTAKESSRVYIIIGGIGYLNITIVNVGNVNLTEIYHVSEIEESNFPNLLYIALFSSIYFVKKKRKAKCKFF
ncbi:MAG: hypothetical protein GPJ54_11190 [Candidatus Heimdallarchaeota archaeon]|nr:hypothetical protein [Candidatus Heimdallarchaeota archaeon]